MAMINSQEIIQTFLEKEYYYYDGNVIKFYLAKTAIKKTPYHIEFMATGIDLIKMLPNFNKLSYSFKYNTFIYRCENDLELERMVKDILRADNLVVFS